MMAKVAEKLTGLQAAGGIAAGTLATVSTIYNQVGGLTNSLFSSAITNTVANSLSNNLNSAAASFYNPPNINDEDLTSLSVTSSDNVHNAALESNPITKIDSPIAPPAADPNGSPATAPAATGNPIAPKQQSAARPRSARIAEKKGLPKYFRYGGRGVPSLTVDTQELIPQDLNPIRLALEALLCFMIWLGSKKCDSIKGFLITVLVAILLLFSLMAITMGIVTGRNCGVGGKDLLQRIVYYAFVSIGYYFTDLFSGGAGDIFAKFATKTATFGALYFLFESVTAVSEKKKPLKEEAKKLLKNLKKEKK